MIPRKVLETRIKSMQPGGTLTVKMPVISSGDCNDTVGNMALRCKLNCQLDHFAQHPV